jgi:hypothetical protein
MDFLDRFNKVMGTSSVSEAESPLLESDRRTSSLECSAAVREMREPSMARLFLTDNDVVLEQSQPFFFLKNSKTGFFSICLEATEAPLFKSSSWSAAYRTWLDLIQVRRSQHSPQTIEAKSAQVLHDRVHHHQNDPGFGQLLYSRDLRFSGVLQYSVQISEAIALHWTAGNLSKGILTLDKVGRRQHRLAKWIEPQPQSVIAASLHCAIDIFHQQWDYNFNQFNSEHWAKLMVTGHCCCDQTDEIASYWRQMAIASESGAAMPEILTLNLAAQDMLKASLNAIQPEHFTP